MAVQARLERVSTAGGLSPVLEKAAVTEARQLARTLTDDPDSLPARYLLGWLHWHRYQALAGGRGQRALKATVTMFTACFISGMSDLPEPLLPLLADQAVPAAVELLERAQHFGDQELLSTAANLWHRILTATEADNPDRADRLSNLGAALAIRFESTGEVGDLDAAITYLGQAVQATPADHPGRAPILSNLGAALEARFRRTGAAGDLDAAIEAGQQAVQATPAKHPGRAGRLSNLGNALQARFERTGAAGDLDAAIEAGQQAVQATPPNTPTVPHPCRTSGTR
jgi:tetratricopeptide (TPR) repeat protein